MIEKISTREKSRVVIKMPKRKYDLICGTENPGGLGAAYYFLENGEVAIPFKCTRLQEGHEGFMHGGISASVLDGGMGRAVIMNSTDRDRCSWMTGSISINYLRPIAVDRQMLGVARVDRREDRKVYTSGEILDVDGRIMVEAKGIFISVEKLSDNNAADLSTAPGPEDPEEL